MPFAFFLVSADASAEAARALNTFLATHTVVRVTREWCGSGSVGSWAFCIEYTGAATEVGGAATRVDYREILPPKQFEVYARLRALRKTLSDREGQPPFAVFTNAQLAEIVRRECRTVDDLKGIDGLGEARIARYGAEVLASLAEGGEK
ncbi:MAG: HRDC domain-containing protein [Verrucomicrobiae bacterium]|nr:HRDC domain-containing protein [Verrucomicrobiae bacterium]